jgi:hypothetical protein
VPQRDRDDTVSALRGNCATKWGDPKDFPWTMGWQPAYQSESRIYAKCTQDHYPNGKIGVLYQNDDYGKDYLKGLKDGLGDKVSMIVAEVEVTDPTVDSQIVKLKASGADISSTLRRPNSPLRRSRRSPNSPGSRFRSSTSFQAPLAAFSSPLVSTIPKAS